ncbi:ankyrin repeat-containing domain protein, partial [Baffinella frigidus]
TTPLQLAVWLGNVEIVEILLENGASIYVTSHLHWSLLVTAISSHSDENSSKIAIIRMLLERRANANDTDCDGVTPLQVAARLGLVEVVHLLILHGADVRAADHRDCTSLHAAASRGYTQIASLLISKGLDIYSKNRKGDT